MCTQVQLVVAVVVAASVASAGEIQDMVKKINSDPNVTWIAADSGRFSSFDEAKVLCGTFMKGDPRYIDPALEEQNAYGDFDLSALPTSLDLRATHPECPGIGKIHDQSACGSCWAFSSVESFGDRRCIAKGADIEFSALDTATNGNVDVDGCKGGQPALAMKWMVKTGVVTGGDYPDDHTGKSCQPYPFPPCAHHTDPGAYPACPKTEYRMNRTKACTDSAYTTKSYKADKVKGNKATQLKTVDAAMQALQQGSVSVAFDVYADFLTYKSGVYKHTGHDVSLGGHAVAVIGYGTDPTGGDYWLVKNSWNEKWGDQGTFKIARGTNECGIEKYMTIIDF